MLLEVDELGERVAGILWDPEDLDAAYSELDARFAAGEGASIRPLLAGVTAIGTRDWKTLTAGLAPDFVLIDHRPLGWEPIRGASAYIATLESLYELAPDARLRIEHVVLSRSASLAVITLVGTREGGAFESPRVVVNESDALGRIRRWDFYNDDQLEEARRRFAEIRFDPLCVPANAASITSERIHRALNERDWESLETIPVDTLVFEERRRVIQNAGSRDMFIADCRTMGGLGVRAENSLLAVAGDRLALHHVRWTRSEGDVVLQEVETVDVFEVDAEGRLIALISFDPADRGAASAELLDRFARGGGAGSVPMAAAIELNRAVNAHDVGALRAILPDDFVWHDHRRTGPGRLEGADRYIAWVKALFEQSPDALIEPMYVSAMSPHGSLLVGHGFGTMAGGGSYEWLFALVWRFRDGELAGGEVFELDDLDAARARLDALGKGPEG
jgi:ketosteroid isomerase-like protein